MLSGGGREVLSRVEGGVVQGEGEVGVVQGGGVVWGRCCDL